ncbi:hypothetical protein CP8484711_0432A, partial [Chlamydia psittaci 84-8471/1]
MLSLLSLF